MTNNVLNAALDLIDRNFDVVPLEPRSKAGIAGWGSLVVIRKNADQYFGANRNIGVRLGRPSGLCDVDLDCQEAGSVAPNFLPPTSMISGRISNPRSHHFYLSDLAESEDCAANQYKDIDGSVLCELRTGGGGTAIQTMVPPSRHPSGETLQWYTEGEPTNVLGDDLKKAVAKCAAAALLARHWPAEGSRHQAALALDGFLTRADWPKEDRQVFVEAVATAAGDDELRDRTRVGDHTEEKLARGKRISGLPKLEHVFGKDIVKKIVEWLEYPGWCVFRKNGTAVSPIEGQRLR